MVEPTETQSRETVEALATALLDIAGDDPDTVRASPVRTPVGRLDEGRAARTLDINWGPA
jgi:glycine dehydrogenase subunit 2